MKKLIWLALLAAWLSCPGIAQNYTYYNGLYFDSGPDTPTTCTPPPLSLGLDLPISLPSKAQGLLLQD
jgi:hypothetical protein